MLRVSRQSAWRAYQLSVPFVATAAVFTVVAIVATQSRGPWFGALLAGLGGLGAFAGSALSRPARSFASHLGAAFRWVLSSAWAISFGLAVLSLVLGAPVWLIAVLASVSGVLTGWVSVSRRQAAARWGASWLRIAGPTGRVGATIGAVAGSFIATHQWWWLLAASLLLPVFSPLSSSSLQPLQLTRARARRHFLSNAAFSFLAMGPIAAMPSLVTVTAGPQWVGPTMAIYALGAVASPALLHRFPAAAPRGISGYLGAAALANASWLLVAVAPVAGLLASRALSAVAVFSAEGSADVGAAEDDALGPAVSGRSLGASMAALVVAMLLGLTGSVLLTTAVLALVSGLGAVCAAVLGRRPLPLKV